MNISARRRLHPSFDFVPHMVSVIAVAVGLLVLIGWFFNLDTLKSVLPGLTPMKANTAMSFILAGVALWGIEMGVQNRPLRVVAHACAGMVLLIGVFTLVEYISGADFALDQLLIREVTHLPGDIPGRMAVNTALSFAALGAAMLLLNLGKVCPSVVIHALAIVPIILGGSALIGYSYNIEEFLRERLNYTPMAIHTAAIFVLLAFGVVNARAEYPFRRFVASSNPAGVMVRLLLPAAIGFTLVTGWLILQGYRAGYFSETFSLALFTAASITGLGAMILWNAKILYEAAVLRERAEESLRENEEQLNTIIKILPVGLWVLDAEGKVAYSNIAAQQIWAGVRYVDLERLGEYKGWWIDSGRLVGPHEWAGARAVEKGETSIEEEIEIECFDGTHKIILDSAVPLRRSDGSIRGAVTINQDITERKKLEHELEQQARKDMLTGLNNRRYFFELAELELARSRRYGEPLSLLMMDLDNFKSVNDTCGHHVGDAVLQKLGEICLHAFREIDFVGRLGGEEFAALLPETSGEQALEVAERLRLAVEGAAVKLENGSFIHFTVSIGVASLEATDARIDVVLKRADAALYKAKNSGRNRVCGEGIV